MSIGAWDPESKKTSLDINIDPQLLLRLVAIGEKEDLTQLESLMLEPDKQQQALMQADLAGWQAAVADYSDEQLTALIRFFTKVEMTLNHWIGGAKSPVISLNRILRSRGKKLDKAMLLWIKQNSDNRFIPNGPPM